MGRYGFGDEGVAGYDGAFPDDRIAAQDAGSRVDGDVVFDGRMAFGALELLTRAQREGAEGHALVNLDVVPDDRRLADDHAGGVVDEEVFPDLGAGVDVHAGDAMACSLMMRGMRGTSAW